MSKLKIATHDSATGEKPKNFLSWLLIPFARTQGKTIKEQYEAGARMFDLRIRQSKNVWHMAHGPFMTKKTFIDILSELSEFDETCYILVTYEGKLVGETELAKFISQVNYLKENYPKIKWGPVAVKYTDNDAVVDWRTILPAKFPANEQAFLPLDGKHWQTFLPIPWLWKQFYFRKVIFSSTIYKFVDFL